MLCLAAVSAAAWAGCLLALLSLGPGPGLGPGLGLCVAAEDHPEPDPGPCGPCFYRQTPPRGASELRPLCDALPTGQPLATFHRGTCATAVCSALRLAHGWTDREEDDISVVVPALLRGSDDPPDLPDEGWVSAVTALVQSSVAPQCAALGGDLYILTGAGGLGAAGAGEDECGAEPLWSAACCAGPGGEGGFSGALVRETGEEERQVSVKELEAILGVAELFSGGCGAVDEEAVGATAGLHTQAGGADSAEAETYSAAADSEETRGESAASDQNADAESSEGAKAEERETFPGARSEKGCGKSSEAEASESSRELQEGAARSEAVRSAAEPLDDYTPTTATQEDENSTSTVLFILSTASCIIKAPLCTFLSIFTQLPGQVGSALQEHLSVLCSLPGDTVSVFHLLSCDLVSGVGSAAETLMDVGGGCFSRVYYCISSMLGALLSSCYIGVTGVGTLAADTLGIFGDALDNAWWVTRFFGGRLWEQSEGYVGTVVSELGGQVQAVGCGLGRLVWQSGKGVGYVLSTGGSVMVGTLEVLMGAVTDPFRQESE